MTTLTIFDNTADTIDISGENHKQICTKSLLAS